MEFNPYESKPVTRMAFQITEDMIIVCQYENSWYVSRGLKPNRELIHFNADEQVNVGDWVIRITDEDTYHCTDAVFRERNIVHSHTLYTNKDKDKPEQICDSNGQVVLDLCKFCNRAEAELIGPCDY